MLSEGLTERLETIAKQEGYTPESFLRLLLDVYESRDTDEEDSIEAFIGVFDDDVKDLSTSVRQTLRRKFREYDDSST
jgi:hypothetical protein